MALPSYLQQQVLTYIPDQALSIACSHCSDVGAVDQSSLLIQELQQSAYNAFYSYPMNNNFRGKHPEYFWVKKPSSAPRLLEYKHSNDGWRCYDLAGIAKALERILGDKRLIADAKIKAMDELVSTDWTQLKIAGVNPILLVVVERVVESIIGVRARLKVGDQARGQVRRQVWIQLEDQVWTQLEDRVGGQVGEQVWAQCVNQVCAQSRSQFRSQTDVQLESQIQTAVKEYLGGQSSSTAENILRPIIHYASLVYKLQYVAKLNDEPSFANKLKQLCSDNNITMDSYAGFVPEFKVFLTEMLKQTNEPLIQRQLGTLLNHLSGQALESN